MSRLGPSQMMGAIITAGAVLGGGVVGGLTAFTLNGRRRPWPPYTFSPLEVGVPAEDVSFTSDDGVPLAGWWMDQPASPLVVICCHGHRGGKADMLGISSGLWRAAGWLPYSPGSACLFRSTGTEPLRTESPQCPGGGLS